MFEKLRYEIVPYIKVRALLFWWIIRYGGAKNIPREVLAKRMEENIKNLHDNLTNALRALPDDASEQERNEVLDAIREANAVERLYRKGQREKKDNEQKQQ